MEIFKSYASYYDDLYQEKKYTQEAAYVVERVRQLTPNARTLLDLGCGTGKHARALVAAGFDVFGVDMSSEMLHHAQQESELGGIAGARLCFEQGDARSIRLQKTFDVVTSLFHVLSYQVSNDDVRAFFTTVLAHLKPGGVFVVDGWYGPAILANMPETRVKKIETPTATLTRLTQPHGYWDRNSVAIEFTLFVEDKITGSISQIHETHEMRYFFKPEIMSICDELGLELIGFTTWLTNDAPSLNDRDVCIVGRKK